MIEARTPTHNINTGCVDDRLLAIMFGEPFDLKTMGELNQLPGADVFFSLASDIITVANIGLTGSTLSESVGSDAEFSVEQGRDYVVHNDDSDNFSLSGCGFLEHIEEIGHDLVKNFEEVFEGSRLETDLRERAKKLVDGISLLINTVEFNGRPYKYLDKVGAELVRHALDHGAKLVTYEGAHTGKRITVDEQTAHTYDSVDAHSNKSGSEPRYNLDTNHAEERGETLYDISSKDATILARLLAVSTVRVLTGGKINKLDRV